MSLIIKNLCARVKDGADILNGINLEIPTGEVHVHIRQFQQSFHAVQSRVAILIHAQQTDKTAFFRQTGVRCIVTVSRFSFPVVAAEFFSIFADCRQSTYRAGAWRGKAFRRTGDEYQLLLDRAYDALYKNPGFVKALRDSDGKKLTHGSGKRDTGKTVLTEYEFISRLSRLRERALKEENCRD